MNEIYFEVICKLGKRVYVTKARWELIIKTKHLEMEGKEKEAKDTLTEPGEIKQSVSDDSVFLYYKRFGKKLVAVVAKHDNGSGFIITTYTTDRIKEGKQFYAK